MDRTTRFRPRLAVTPLEDRSVPAAGPFYISEVHFNPLFGSTSTDQYFEVRGDPGATIPARTYFVVVDGKVAGPSASSGPGVLQSVFDLGGSQLGSGGYLVVAQGGNPYTFAAGSTVLQGASGFGQLPGNRFSDNSTLSDSFSVQVGSSTFMLVSARTPPRPNDDVDANDDGILDGAAGTWTVDDAVGVVSPTAAGSPTDVAYGGVNFRLGTGTPVTPAGSTLITAQIGLSHVARVGESTGYAATDWVGDVTRVSTAGEPFRYENGIFGIANQRVFAGASLTNLGTSNFVSSVEGRVFSDANGNGSYDAGEAGVAGQTVWLDRNGDGALDDFETQFSAASLPVGAELTNAVPGATLTTIDTVTNTVARDTQVTSTGTPATSYIGSNNVGFFTPTTQLRVDFYRPVDSVSIDFFGSTPLSDVFGRMNAYDAQGNLLATYLSPATNGSLPNPGVTLSISRPTADIAYVIAFPDPSGFTFTYFDNLRFSQPEPSAVTDSTGKYKIGLLQDGTYPVATGNGTVQTATIAGLVPVRGVDVPVGGGSTGGGGGTGTGTGTAGRGRTLAVGGNAGSVTVLGAGSGQLSRTGIIDFPILFPDMPFDGTYRTATGDVNGDGFEDIAVVTGPGTPVRFAVIDGKTGNSLLVPLTTAFAGSDDFTGGGFVSVGDLDNDGKAEIVLTPDQGGGPRVTIFSVYPVGARVRANFFGIADSSFRGGARTAVGDLNGDGRADLAVAAGFAGGPRVALYNGTTVLSGGLARLTSDFFAFDPALRNGVYLAIGDTNGDGYGDLIIGAGAGGGPAVRVLSGKTLVLGGGATPALAAPLADFLVNGDDTSRGGIRVAAKNVDGDAKSDVVVGSGEGQNSFVRVYAGKSLAGATEPNPLQDVDPFGGIGLVEGVFVG